MTMASSPNAFALLRENAPFRALWLSRTVSFIGDSLSLVALLLFVAAEQGTGTAVAMLLLVGDFTPTLLSPFAGALSDRHDRRKLMIGSELAQGVAVTLIALVAMPLAGILALVAVRTTLSGIFQPASRSAVPSLVREDRLESANAALGFGTNGFEVAGPLVGAALLPFIGLRGMLLADAATFVVSAMLLWRLPALPPVTADETNERGFLRQAADGLRAIWDIRPMRIITIGFCVAVAFSGADDVALVFLAQDSLGGGESAASLLYAGAGTGLLLGFALLAGLGTRTSAMALLIAGFGISSAGNLLTGLSWAIPAAFAMQAVRDFGISLLDIGVNTQVQRIVPPGMQGRVFANLYGAVGLAAGISYAGGGLLLDATGPRDVLVIAGLGGLAATVGIALRLPRAMRATQAA